ncbi:MAG: hypothetical protein Q7T41_01775 [Candidatus Saccharibacteria bacterium]|nr:hypothetical protein [Candidatus Saccharibacteria bacterium]
MSEESQPLPTTEAPNPLLNYGDTDSSLLPPALPTTTELVSTELVRLSLGLEAPKEVGLQWARTEADSSGIVRVVNGVHLGAIIGSDGWNNGYKDEHTQPVPDAGFSFKVSQASYGYTGISAEAMEGHRVDALDVDVNTGEYSWKGPRNHSDEVTVSSDRGKMQEVKPEDWGLVNLGKTGGRAGIIRVTSKVDGNVRYYALGADFQGEPDNWRVTGSLVEVTPNDPKFLPTAQTAIEQ